MFILITLGNLMSKKLIPIFAALFVTAAATSSFAEEKKFYVGAEVGSASVENRAQESANELVAALGGSATVTQTVRNGAGRIFVGLELHEHVDVEVGYIQSQDFKTTVAGRSGGGVNYAGTGTVSVNGFDYSVLLRPSKASGFNSVFLRVGQHDYESKSSVSLTAGGNTVTLPNLTESGNGTMLGLGFDWNFEKNTSVRFAVTQLNKMSGVKGADATFVSVGLKAKF
jgi:hypothetical protein